MLVFPGGMRVPLSRMAVGMASGKSVHTVLAWFVPASADVARAFQVREAYLVDDKFQVGAVRVCMIDSAIVSDIDITVFFIFRQSRVCPGSSSAAAGPAPDNGFLDKKGVRKGEGGNGRADLIGKDQTDPVAFLHVGGIKKCRVFDGICVRSPVYDVCPGIGVGYGAPDNVVCVPVFFLVCDDRHLFRCLAQAVGKFRGGPADNAVVKDDNHADEKKRQLDRGFCGKHRFCR